MIVIAIGFAAFTMPAAAILTPKADVRVPSTYATVSGGKILYEKSPTAFCSITFNKILEAYGLILKPEAVSGVPTSYAKVSDGKVIFNDTPIAYEPVAYHSIFTAYGLQLSPENVKAKLGAVDYAKVIDGKIVFTKVCVAYSGEGFAEILAAYTLPVAVTPAPVPPMQPKQVEKKGWTLSSDGEGATVRVSGAPPGYRPAGGPAPPESEERAVPPPGIRGTGRARRRKTGRAMSMPARTAMSTNGTPPAAGARTAAVAGRRVRGPNQPANSMPRPGRGRAATCRRAGLGKGKLSVKNAKKS